VQLDTRSGTFLVTNSANVTASSITFPVPQTATPSGDGVIEMGGTVGALAPNGLILVPFGVGSATNTFTMNAYGWRRTVGGGVPSTDPLWVAYQLAAFTVTLCTVPGLANTDVNASQLFTGTITLTSGNANVSTEVVSPTGNVVAHIVLDAKGSQFVELRFGTGGSATSCNCLAAKV
jgi:hypothetical protein